MRQATKDYPKAFLVEPTKLTRLLDVIHSRLNDQPDFGVNDNFEVFTSGNRQEQLATLDEVLALENSRKQRIQRLLIVSSSLREGHVRSEKEIQVDFGVIKASSNNSTPSRVVTVTARSDNPGWNTRSLSEVEEQVERTWVNYAPATLALVGVIVITFVIGFLQFVRFDNSEDASKVMWLDDQTLGRLEQLLKRDQPLTEQEVREITTAQLRNVVRYQRPNLPQPNRRRRLILFGIPFLLVIGCAAFLLLTCYPKAVFLWGDEVEKYRTILQRRKALWGVIATLMVVGILSRFLAEGVSSWLPNG